ncbi:hypothetical protein ACLX1H_010585 [Fusarium chlamydosporum]
MAVYKLKAIASILAFCAPFAAATGVQGESAPSAHTETESPYTHEYGAAISDGTVIHSMTVCSIVHETKCTDTTSVGDATMQGPSAATAASSVVVVQPSVPAGGAQTTYQGQGVPSDTQDVPAPTVPVASATVVPGVPGAPGASGTNYAPPAGASDSAASAEHGSMPPINPSGVAPSQGSEGVPPAVPSVISTTDASGNPTMITSVYSQPSAAVSDTVTAVVTGTETGYDTTVSGTAIGTDAEETGDGTPTGTPGVTASAAAKMLTPGALLGFAGIFFA